ncbi:MAG TPA: PIN domain-containing protein [Acidobacteria bacterium]|nr:PIN domain-containing protein [Acidobacteriota bacterium]
MIFVDTNVIMYAVGRPHALRPEARSFFEWAVSQDHNPLCTSAEVLQELLHAYIPVGRMETLDAALKLAASCIPQIYTVGEEDVRLARLLADTHSHLGARDLIHLAVCRRNAVRQVKTFDRALASAFAE